MAEGICAGVIVYVHVRYFCFLFVCVCVCVTRCVQSRVHGREVVLFFDVIAAEFFFNVSLPHLHHRSHFTETLDGSASLTVRSFDCFFILSLQILNTPFHI